MQCKLTLCSLSLSLSLTLSLARWLHPGGGWLISQLPCTASACCAVAAPNFPVTVTVPIPNPRLQLRSRCCRRRHLKSGTGSTGDPLAHFSIQPPPPAYSACPSPSRSRRIETAATQPNSQWQFFYF